MIYKIIPANFQPLFEVVSCFFQAEGDLLLLHRKDGTSQGGKWGFPGGKVGVGETLAEAMTREIEEETGYALDKESLQYFDKVPVEHPGHQFIYHMFSVALPAKPLIQWNPLEHQGFLWASQRAALTLPLVEDLDECLTMFFGSALR